MAEFTEILKTVSRLNHVERAELLRYIQLSGESAVPTDAVEESRAEYGAAVRYMTLEEFFDFQERSPITYEYVNGVIRAMSGPSVAHCLITQNIFRAVDARLRGGPCEAFCTGGQLKLSLGDDQIVYHPDLYVSCERGAWSEKWIANPKFVVEVLSPSTQHIDRREKLVNYRRTPTLEEYVIARQQRPELEIYRRSGNWRQEVIDRPEMTVEFRSLDVCIPLAAVYDGVSFKPLSHGILKGGSV